MKQEDKELILKDVCARLPYGIKGAVQVGDMIPLDKVTDYSPLMSFKNAIYKHGWRPYLFPLSSMTAEQKEEYEDALTYHDYVKGGWTIAKSFDEEYIIPYWFVDFCNKNHFDYRDLIPKGLALDATGLNIY